MDWSYQTTLLEDWITTFYQQLGILKPNDLCIEKIAQLCNIILLKDDIDSYYIANNYLKMIVIDSRLSKEKQKEVFFHELCHILRHTGIQGIMPNAFRELQEWDAVRFTKYAAIPFHMLKYINPAKDTMVADMSEVFQVTPELCKQRLTQIQRKIQIKECLT
ncbi:MULTISPECIES: ImmA/IrrE family metallo-endopeptidase [Bacillus]|uniref:ImmA/IrrE family metallo-endopeptidase n=1 Tax=Bacillus paramycoides TaxID=2026194 RepID=A0ABU6MSN1_9BACI|nr:MULTISPECIES: ImmA/IrrE family metallo-endopeptidase [Bacillus]MED1089708.1 ImmA/IrrE family metallo-endopeptidase [Bacillus paramycoides]MED1564408.1 ImmA/IrrE family metallo-endopeptidase [Bacillus paramycoides]